jgi:carbamoyl-phosphate synthase small subunit
MPNHDTEPLRERACTPAAPGAAGAGCLELEDGTRLAGTFFGNPCPAEGEVVFNTGMVGYVESLTDPSYRGQILTLTYPLIGNYGVPRMEARSRRFESGRIQVRALVVGHYHEACGHWEAERSLGAWLQAEGIPGLTGVDTRELTKILRSRGTMLGRIHPAAGAPTPVRVADPNAGDLVGEVSCREIVTHSARGRPAGPHILVVDCGCKRSILNELLDRNCRVTVVPYDYDLASLSWDGLLLSNGPGNPRMCRRTIAQVDRLLRQDNRRPIAGICLGCQILALAAGAQTYKLPYGHRGQNQPVILEGTASCRITSQNHGYAVEAASLPPGWEIWFRNLNDGTVEGIRHAWRPLFAVQFHPEAAPGPTDTRDFFDRLVEAARDV